MLLLGTVATSVVFGLLLENFSQIRLIQVIQGAGLLTIVLNGFALWKQEVRDTRAPRLAAARRLHRLARLPRRRRSSRLVSVGLGAAASACRTLLEPYGGQVLDCR